MVRFCPNCHSTNIKQSIGRTAATSYECQNCGLVSKIMPEAEKAPALKKSFNLPSNDVKPINKYFTIIILTLLVVVMITALIIGFLRI